MLETKGKRSKCAFIEIVVVGHVFCERTTVIAQVDDSSTHYVVVALPNTSTG